MTEEHAAADAPPSAANKIAEEFASAWSIVSTWPIRRPTTRHANVSRDSCRDGNRYVARRRGSTARLKPDDRQHQC
jgi:hypothetical protein